MAPILVGETSSKYINKKLKNIITDHNKGTRRDQGQGHFRQTGDESSRGWKAEKGGMNDQSLVLSHHRARKGKKVLEESLPFWQHHLSSFPPLPASKHLTL